MRRLRVQTVTAHRQLTLGELTRQLAQPTAVKPLRLRQVKPLSVLYADTAKPKRRQQTLMIRQDEFLLLVDTFHSAKPGRFSLTLTTERPMHGGRRRYVTQDDAGPLAVHPLGDYQTETTDAGLKIGQNISNGRFLVAVTRDPDAAVRVSAGWSVEVQTKSNLFHVLHSNRSRQLRPLGPIRTDARFGVVSCTNGQDGPHQTDVLLVQAGEVLWGEERRLTLETPGDLQLRESLS